MDEVTKKVLEFYKMMPFNIYEDLDKACNNIISNPLYNTYPFLKENLFKSKNILDVGCGGGWIVNNIGYHLKNKQITGIDINPVAVNFGQQISKKLKNEVNFKVMDLFDYKEKHHDFIISMGVLHHTKDCLKALNHVCAIGSKGTVIYIGLYHKVSRKPFLDFVNSLNNLDENQKFQRYKELHKLTDEKHLKSWFRDQVLHPHETQHTLSEVLNIFKKNNYEFSGTSINHFKEEDMEVIQKKEKELIEYAREKIEKKIYYPGFFITAGIKK